MALLSRSPLTFTAPRALQDVWSAGCVLFFLTAAEQVGRKLGGEVFGFFSYTAQACPLTERNQEKIKLWHKCHTAVGGCLFFEADRWGKVRPEKRGENGVPIVDRDEKGHPTYPRLWRFLERQGTATSTSPLGPPFGSSHACLVLCPFVLVFSALYHCTCSVRCTLPSAHADRTGANDARNTPTRWHGQSTSTSSGGMYSPELKNLLSRMLDVDPKRRIKIEDVRHRRHHFWLISGPFLSCCSRLYATPRVAVWCDLLSTLCPCLLDAGVCSQFGAVLDYQQLQVCTHPWLQSHQAPRNYFLGPQPALTSLEKPKEKAAFMEHMRMRTAKYIEKATPGKQVLFLFFFFLNASLLRPFFLRRKGEGRLGSALRGNSRGSRGVCEDRRWTYPPARVPSSGCAARLLFIMPRISPAFHQHFTPALCRPKHWNTPRD